MEEINKILMTNDSTEHSLNLLKKIISSITKNNNSNITRIKRILDEIEKTLILIYKTKYNDVAKNKIEIINNSTIKELYAEDIKLLERDVYKQKEELRKELNKLDKKIECNIKIEKKDTNIEIKENEGTKTTIQDIFDIITIDEIIKNIDLEEINKIYYKELYSSPLEDEGSDFFVVENKNIIRLSKYPLLRITKKLRKYFPEKYTYLEKQTIKVANLKVKTLQLEDLRKFTILHNLKNTTNYINKSLNSINKLIEDNTKLIINIIKNLVQTKNKIYEKTEEEQKIIEDILTELLSIINEEAQLQYSYCGYEEFIEEAIEEYKRFLITEKYNINFSIEDILTEIENRKNYKTIKEAPKTNLIKKLKKIKILKPIKK